MVWNNTVLYLFPAIYKVLQGESLPSATQREGYFQEEPTENGFSLTTCVYTSLLVLQVKVRMLCEFEGLEVWSIEVNKAAAGYGVLKAPAFKHMQGHPKLQGVTHMHISKKIRATWQKCFHMFWFPRSEIRLWYLKFWLYYKNFHILSIFHMGPKSSHALHIVWLHVLLSVFLGVFVTSDPQKCELLQIQETKKLVINTTSPPSTAAFYKVIIILHIIINIFVHLLLIKANLKRCYSVANPAPDWLLLNRAWL